MFTPKYINIFSYIVIALSAASLSGLSLADTVLDSMKVQQIASAPTEPVERFRLGQNAFEWPSNTRATAIRTVRSVSFHQNDKIGRYQNGFRLLVPNEPALKSERLRLEQEEKWYAEYFANADDVSSEYQRTQANWPEETEPAREIELGHVSTVEDSNIEPVTGKETIALSE
ncbi:hypothetical protein [Parasphingorhabdus cellanae]|uniref:Uncharacterized protein n=1 Tax=Parasphingorhabdus cellanae TaxID=2806553 RepID=A0ABX7T4R2_9SPHN|nr:hypothetical protein [Parasphingorhabdus cellanae]QTD54973.1 hypothetical protein J4G78_12085 [Parasphingorhabdus cellanae]